MWLIGIGWLMTFRIDKLNNSSQKLSSNNTLNVAAENNPAVVQNRAQFTTQIPQNDKSQRSIGLAHLGGRCASYRMWYHIEIRTLDWGNIAC